MTFSDTEVKMIVKIDIEDFDSLIENPTDHKQVEYQFRELMQFTKGDKLLEFALMEMEKDKEFYILSFSSKINGFENERLYMKTTLLVENDPKHSNIIKVTYQNKTRGFRLHQKRLETSLILN
jgi:hypothetical protein